MVFRSDDEKDQEQNPSPTGDTPGSLVIKITNQITTRQGTIYEVINY